MKFDSIKPPLENDLKNAGFNIKIIVKIDEEKAQELREEIEKEKNKIIPKSALKKKIHLSWEEKSQINQHQSI